MTQVDRTKTLILGMGNDIISDDAIGLHVARALRQTMPEDMRSFVDVEETSESYFALLDHLDNYDRLIVVDAVQGPDEDIGRVGEMKMDTLTPKRAPTILHGCNPAQILRMAQAMPGVRVPNVRILGITIGTTQSFGEELSPRVAQAIQPALNAVMAMLGETTV